MATYGNGSEDAEAAYTEAAAAVNEFLAADAALHPPTGASSSSSTLGWVGRGVSSLGLETYRAFLKGKGKGGGTQAAGPGRDGSEDLENPGQGEDHDPEQENYEEEMEEYDEEVEEEEVDDGNETSVEVSWKWSQKRRRKNAMARKEKKILLKREKNVVITLNKVKGITLNKVKGIMGTLQKQRREIDTSSMTRRRPMKSTTEGRSLGPGTMARRIFRGLVSKAINH